MQVPRSNFGNVVAEPERQALAPSNMGADVANAANRLGQTGLAIGEDMLRVEKQKATELKRAQAATSLATLTNDAHDAHDQIQRDVTEGKLKTDEAIPLYQKRIQEVTAMRTEGLDDQQRGVINDNIIRATGTLERSLRGTIIKRQQSEIGSSLSASSEALQREALRDLPGAVAKFDTLADTLGPQAGMAPEVVAKAKQAFVEGATFNFANATLEGAAQSGNMDLVRAARARIEGPEGEAIDPARRTALITKAYGYENGIVAAGIRETEKADRELKAREAKAKDTFQSAMDLSLSGRYMSQEFISQLANETAGTSHAAAAQELVKSQSQIAGFASLSLPQQRATIERANAQGSDPKVGINPTVQKTIDHMEKITAASEKAYKENPWQAAQERGVIPDAPVANITDITGAQQILGERMAVIGQVEDAAGAKISPLQPQEAEQIGRIIRMLPPDQQSAALASFGNAVPDADRLAAMAKQMGARDKVLGTAMMYANAATTQGRFVSELILKGDRAIRDKSITIDGVRETGWRGQIAQQIGDAFPNQEVRDQMIESAYLIQAGQQAEGNGNVDRAVRLATGGIREQRDGSKIPIPYGMSEEDFDKRINGITPDSLSLQAPGGSVYVGKNAVSIADFVKQLPDASLVHAGQGRYNVRAGMGLVTNKDGKRILIEVRNAR